MSGWVRSRSVRSPNKSVRGHHLWKKINNEDPSVGGAVRSTSLSRSVFFSQHIIATTKLCLRTDRCNPDLNHHQPRTIHAAHGRMSWLWLFVVEVWAKFANRFQRKQSALLLSLLRLVFVADKHGWSGAGEQIQTAGTNVGGSSSSAASSSSSPPLLRLYFIGFGCLA